MRTADFDYFLPPELIAQEPVPQRDQSRLLVFERATGAIAHQQFPQLLDHLREGDLLVLNNSKVIPARLRGCNRKTGGQFEILLVEENSRNDWWAMMRPGKRARIGTEIDLMDRQKQTSSVTAQVIEVNEEGHRRLQFSGTDDILSSLDRLGEIPLPPYIERSQPKTEDLERYQTVYAQSAGSVAAPTAGLHFTPALLDAIARRGVAVCHVTLHVGLGTFAPVKADEITEHVMHTERFEVSEAAAQAINLAKQAGRRVIAVGTTSVRVLESVARNHNGKMASGSGKTNIFIYPPCEFRIVDALVTNFHLPCSTLLMLVSAFAAPGGLDGREKMLAAYQEAIRERYRFFSYGDAMFIY